MMIYDISQELFQSYVYPGDPIPEKKQVLRIEDGDKCNLTSITMCCHNGTHIDAPSHFVADGKTVEKINLEKFVGKCNVVEAGGLITATIMKEILKEITTKKLLLKGALELSVEAVEEIIDANVDLIGVENCTVGNECTGEKIHKLLLNREIVILEGIRLDLVSKGEYFLCAQPLKLEGVEGAPCRAILLKD